LIGSVLFSTCSSDDLGLDKGQDKWKLGSLAAIFTAYFASGITRGMPYLDVANSLILLFATCGGNRVYENQKPRLTTLLTAWNLIHVSLCSAPVLGAWHFQLGSSNPPKYIWRGLYLAYKEDWWGQFLVGTHKTAIFMIFWGGGIWPFWWDFGYLCVLVTN
jgi:hypothetical protein